MSNWTIFCGVDSVRAAPYEAMPLKQGPDVQSCHLQLIAQLLGLAQLTDKKLIRLKQF